MHFIYLSSFPRSPCPPCPPPRASGTFSASTSTNYESRGRRRDIRDQTVSYSRCQYSLVQFQANWIRTNNPKIHISLWPVIKSKCHSNEILFDSSNLKQGNVSLFDTEVSMFWIAKTKTNAKLNLIMKSKILALTGTCHV